MGTVVLVTGIGLLVGIALIVVGAIWHAISPRSNDQPSGPIDALWWLMKRAFAILFDTKGIYSGGQRLMAAGMLISALSGIVLIGALTAIGLGVGDGNGGTTTDVTTTA